MTNLMQQHRYQNETGQDKYTRDHARAGAADLNQQQEDQQEQESKVDAEFYSAKPHREYRPVSH
jgi:hypothetical protein